MSWPGGGGPKYDVIHPVTGKPCAVPPGGWRYSTPEKMEEMIKENYDRIKNETSGIVEKELKRLREDPVLCKLLPKQDDSN